MSHKAFGIPVTIRNGFDVVVVEGVLYLRVITGHRAAMAVPQTSAELRTLAGNLQKAADLADAH